MQWWTITKVRGILQTTVPSLIHHCALATLPEGMPVVVVCHCFKVIRGAPPKGEPGQ